MREEETLYINSDVLDKFMSGVNKCSLRMSNHIDSSERDYKRLKEIDLYKNGFNKVEKGMNETTHTMINCNKVNEEFLTKFILLEEKGKEIIDELYIPNDLKTGNDFSTSIFNQTNLNKNDGEQVKTHMEDDDDTIDESNIVKEEIVNDNKELDSSVEIEDVNVTKQDINNLNKEVENEAKTLEEIAVSEANIDHINSNKIIEENVIGDINISKEQLNGIDNKIVIDEEDSNEEQQPTTKEEIPTETMKEQEETEDEQL